MNGFEKLKRQDLDTIKAEMKHRKEMQTDRLIAGKFRNTKEEQSIRNSIPKIDTILSSVDKAISTESLRNKVEKSNYSKIPVEILKDLQINLTALKEYLQHKINAGQYKSTEEEHKLRREIHRINPVLDMVNGAIARIKKQAQVGEHVGEVALASDGKTTLKIVKWVNKNNISIEEPNGYRIDYQTYARFKSGRIETHADYIERKKACNKRATSNEDALLRAKYGAVVCSN